MYFMGRFGEKVRDEQGLAYYAYSELHGSYGRGPWLMRAGVNPAQSRQSAGEYRCGARALPPRRSDASRARGRCQQPARQPAPPARNQRRCRGGNERDRAVRPGLDYLERFPDIVRSLTREQVTQAARRWLDPAHMVTTIAGSAALLSTDRLRGVCLERTIELDHVRLAVRDWPGHGAPLIHAPDPLVPSRLADRLAAGLAPSHRVLSVAPRAGVPYQVAAADLVGVLKQFGFLKPVLVGERLGCLSVLILAAWYPERVWRAILVEPTWQASDRESDGESGRETDGESIEARALRRVSA